MDVLSRKYRLPILLLLGLLMGERFRRGFVLLDSFIMASSQSG